jgi:hypothetical protein
MACAYKIYREIVNRDYDELKRYGSVLWIEDLSEILYKVAQVNTATTQIPSNIANQLIPYISTLYDTSIAITHELTPFKFITCKTCNHNYVYLKEISAYLFTRFETTAEKLAVLAVLVSSCVHQSCEYHINRFYKISPLIASGLHHLDSIALKNAVSTSPKSSKHLNPILLDHLNTKRYILHKEFEKKQKELDKELSLFKSFLDEIEPPRAPEPQAPSAEDIAIVYGPSVSSIPLQVECAVSSGTVYKTLKVPVTSQLKRRVLETRQASAPSLESTQSN